MSSAVMKDYDDDRELAAYVWDNHPEYLTPTEARAGLAVSAAAKAAAGSPDMAVFVRKRHGLDDDAAVESELAGGTDAFRLRAAERILREHADAVVVNRCPRCRRVVRTPRAAQCFWCGFDWHPARP
jgi:hypothetical protein